MANIVSLGLIVGLTQVVPEDAVMAAILDRVPKGTEELNEKAFQVGLELRQNV